MTDWYAIRATGTVAIILFTVTVALGLVNQTRWTTDRWPRFVIDRVHRNVSLLATVFLIIHIVTSLTDGFVTIPLLSVFVPFIHSYSPFWLGLGAVAMDLMVAVIITSLLRAQIGHRTWRFVHWLGYISWPVAVVHGIGEGTDAGSAWLLAINGICIALVIAALGARWLLAPQTASSVPRAAGADLIRST